MRRIVKTNNKRNLGVIGIILVLTMLLSTIGFAFFSKDNNSLSENKLIYNNYEFTKENGLWKVTIQEKIFNTRYNPKETEDIEVNFSSSLEDFKNKPLYFVSPNQEATGEILRNLGTFIQRSQEVCLENKKCGIETAVKNCSNNIIIFKESEQTKIYKQENCFFIEGNYEEQVRTSDRLIFQILKVQ